MKLFQKIKEFFKSKYFALYELITLKVMLQANKMLRKLIIMKGKDPDYVVPPPSPPKEDKFYKSYDPIEAQIRVHTFLANPRPAWISSSGYEKWIKDPSLHPVIVARRQFADKQSKPKEVDSVQIVTVSGPGEITIPVTFEDVPQELQVTAQEGSDHE